MKHVFILNPAAGKGDEIAPLGSKLAAECQRLGADYLIYTTKSPGDATRFILRECAEGGMQFGRHCRFYACGGDGTISEVLDGAARVDGAEVGVIPIGTGNDFCRSFTPHELYFDVEAQLNGHVIPLDAVRYNGKYSSNMINIGFDCEVVRETARIKRKPWVPGKLAYIFGAVNTLIRKPGASFNLSVDGGKPEHYDLLLCAIANGPYCGGGFDALPMAELTDGMVNIIKIKDVSRLKFISLVKYYKDGTLPERKETEGLCEYIKCRRAVFEFEKPWAVCVDGEVTEMDRLEIDVEPGKFRFSVPRGAVPGNAVGCTTALEAGAEANG